MSAVASAGYRRLLRSIQVAFKGDSLAITQAKKQLKEEFTKFRGVADTSTLEKLYKDIDDVDELLRFHIVQGKRNDKGSYGKLIHPEFVLYNSDQCDRSFMLC